MSRPLPSACSKQPIRLFCVDVATCLPCGFVGRCLIQRSCSCRRDSVSQRLTFVPARFSLPPLFLRPDTECTCGGRVYPTRNSPSHTSGQHDRFAPSDSESSTATQTDSHVLTYRLWPPDEAKGPCESACCRTMMSCLPGEQRHTGVALAHQSSSPAE